MTPPRPSLSISTLYTLTSNSERYLLLIMHAITVLKLSPQDFKASNREKQTDLFLYILAQSY